MGYPTWRGGGQTRTLYTVCIECSLTTLSLSHSPFYLSIISNLSWPAERGRRAAMRGSGPCLIVHCMDIPGRVVMEAGEIARVQRCDLLRRPAAVAFVGRQLHILLLNVRLRRLLLRGVHVLHRARATSHGERPAALRRSLGRLVASRLVWEVHGGEGGAHRHRCGAREHVRVAREGRRKDCDRLVRRHNFLLL